MSIHINRARCQEYKKNRTTTNPKQKVTTRGISHEIYSPGRNSENRVHVVITHVGTLGRLVFGGDSEGETITTLTDHW